MVTEIWVLIPGFQANLELIPLGNVTGVFSENRKNHQRIRATGEKI